MDGCTHACMHGGRDVYVCMDDACMYDRCMYVCMHVCMYAWMDVYMNVCIPALMDAWMHVYVQHSDNSGTVLKLTQGNHKWFIFYNFLSAIFPPWYMLSFIVFSRMLIVASIL